MNPRDPGCASPVLIADDDDRLREALRDVLTDEGYEVMEARDGLEALEAIRRRRPCLVLLDWNMPRMNGGDFLDALAAEPEYGSVPVVLLTADVHAKKNSQRAGVTGLISKPVDAQLLFSTVATHC